MKIVIHDGERRISTREFAAQWPMRHDNVLAKVREIVEILGDSALLNFQAKEYPYSRFAGAEPEMLPEYLMDWEGFWTLATSCSGPKAMRARRELVDSVKKALSDQRDLAAHLEELQARLAESERRARLYAGHAQRAASEAGRALAAWQQTRLRLELEAGGQQSMPLVLEYPDPRPALDSGEVA